MHSPCLSDVTRSGALRRLVKINAVSFLSQIVQIGTVPALMALRLNAAHHSPMVVGIVAGAPWLAILMLGHWAPRTLSRCGFVATNQIALALSVLALGCALYASDPVLLFGCNFVFGVGLILRWVACDTWIVWAAPEDIRGRAIGTHETLMGCGIAAGPLIIALTGVTGSLPLWTCLALLLLSALTLAALTRSDGHPQVPERAQRLAALRIVPAALMAGFVAGFVETSSLSFLPILSDQHLLALGVTAVLGGFGAGGTLLQLPLGWLADRAGFRRAQLLTASIVGLGAVALPWAGPHPAWLFGLMFLWGGAAGGLNTLAVIEVGHRITGAGLSTGLLAVALAYTAGSTIGPVLTGWVTFWLPGKGLATSTALAVAAFIGVWATTSIGLPARLRAATAPEQGAAALEQGTAL
jgi:MFS family permease